MIIVMKTSATEENLEHLVGQVEALGLKANVLRGTERTVVAAIGDERVNGVMALESAPGVDNGDAGPRPLQAGQPRGPRRPPVGGHALGRFELGGKQIGVIAGTLLAWSRRSRSSQTALAVKAAGATALRGGAFKPRTSPYSFQGMKEDGLKLLALAAGEETGLAVVTEVVSPRTTWNWLANTPRCCRSAPATCRTTACLRRAGKQPPPRCC